MGMPSNDLAFCGIHVELSVFEILYPVYNKWFLKKIVGVESGCPWNGVCSSAEVGIVLKLVFTFWEFCGIPGAKIR
jgi:hypothetical protein